MERGALSDPAFPAFAAKVVPFLHLTTRIEGHPYDDLLSAKGFRGFPSLVFMSADGDVLAGPTDRAVVTFEACLDALGRVDGVRAKAEAGDIAARTELLLLEYDLGLVDGAGFRERAAALTRIDDHQRARIDQILVDQEIWDLVMEDLEKSGPAFLALLEAGKRPSKAPKYAVNFWSILSRWAQGRGDAELLRRCVTGIREGLGTNEKMLRYADSIEKTAQGLVERDALLARSRAGEKRLEAKILLLEVELSAVTFQAFQKRFRQALASATEEEREKLLQAGVDLEANEVWRRANQPGGLEKAGARLLVMLTAKGRRPDARLAGSLWSVVANWASRSDDIEAADLKRIAAGLRGAFADDPSWEQYWKGRVETFEAKIAEGNGGTGGN